MHWNFRVVDHKHYLGGKWQRWSSIEEVYYDIEEGDTSISHTAGLGVSDDDRDGVIKTLKMMLKDAKKAPSVPCRCDEDERKKAPKRGKASK